MVIGAGIVTIIFSLSMIVISTFIPVHNGYFELLIFPNRFFAELISPMVFFVIACLLLFAIVEVFELSIYIGFIISSAVSYLHSCLERRYYLFCTFSSLV